MEVQGYALYPGTSSEPGLKHTFTPGLHLVAGVNGLGKTTLLLLLYHGLIGPAAIKNDDFNVYQPDLIKQRDVDRFRGRVADAAKDATLNVEFTIGIDTFSIQRELNDLSIAEWKLNGAVQIPDEDLYRSAIRVAMNVGAFQDVLVLLNFIIFMFEDQGRLMWSQQAQRNVFKALFLPPKASQEISEKAQAISATNSAYRNLLYIVNRDKKALAKAKHALENADATSAEYNALMQAVTGDGEKLETLIERRLSADDDRIDARTALERARFTYDDTLREIEALKIARIASAFPDASNSGHYILTRILGDQSCLSCGASDGPLIAKWVTAVETGCCVVCGSAQADHEEIVPRSTVERVRLEKADKRLRVARSSLESANLRLAQTLSSFGEIDDEIKRLRAEISANRVRLQEIGGSLPPTPPEIKALEDRLAAEEVTLNQLSVAQRGAELEFSELFDQFRTAIETRANVIREKFGKRISEFLVEIAEISLETFRAPLGESGQSYPWPVFRLSMTSGTFESPSARRSVKDVSMSQGEFIDLAFRLALAEASTDESPVTLVFDAPEASLDALFMRRAGAFLAKFTQANHENRLIVTSNLTNADMIPALFGAYKEEPGDPPPTVIPRSERSARVIDLLSIAAPTRAVQLVGDRYRGLLDRALFPPLGQEGEGL
jgi:tetratricopeptide (TPR) repeat protein